MYTTTNIKKQNQYTDGTEYMIDAKTYIGYYNMTSQGPYTGRVYDSAASQELYKLEFVSSIDAQQYTELVKGTGHITDLEFDDPSNVYITPTDDDYARGNVVRYFIHQRNDKSARIREVNKKQFDNLSDTGAGLNSSFYKGISLIWKLSGPPNDVLRKGIIVEPGVSDTNKRTTVQKEFSMTGIKRFLQYRLLEFSEHAIQSITTNTDIKL